MGSQQAAAAAWAPRDLFDPAAKARQVGAATWAELHDHCVAPTPRAYELWFNYRAGISPDLTRRLGALLTGREALTPSLIDTLHEQYVTGSPVDLDALRAGADGVEDAAQTVVEQVQGGQASIRAFGDTLDHWANHLGDDPTIAGLVRAVATLSAETTRAAERNRQLEHELSSSVARIARLRRSLVDVKQEATTDALTGICNRKAFDARLKRAVGQGRTDPSVPVSLLLLDVDHFKRFNDAHGHQAGDLVLRLVARLLSDNIKGRDTVARYGGEEFAVLLAGADITAATSVGQQICGALAAKRLVPKGTKQGLGHVTISIGVAQYRLGDSGATLVSRADAALYAAKDLGRNRVVSERGGV